MSLIRIVPGKYNNQDALEKEFAYCTKNLYNSKRGCIYWGGTGISNDSIEAAIFDMRRVKYFSGKMDGKQLHHFLVSIKRKDLEESTVYGRYYKRYDKSRDESPALFVGLDVCELVFNIGYQTAYFVHDDSEYFHVHFILNSVNYKTGMKLDNLNTIVNSVFYYLDRTYKSLNWEGVMYY